MREAQVKLYLEMMMDGLEAVRYQDEEWEFARKEGIPFDYENTNPLVLRERIIKYLIDKTRLLWEDKMP